MMQLTFSNLLTLMIKKNLFVILIYKAWADKSMSKLQPSDKYLQALARVDKYVNKVNK